MSNQQFSKLFQLFLNDVSEIPVDDPLRSEILEQCRRLFQTSARAIRKSEEVRQSAVAQRVTESSEPDEATLDDLEDLIALKFAEHGDPRSLFLRWDVSRDGMLKPTELQHAMRAVSSSAGFDLEYSTVL